jgi:hypothetical protein
MRCERSLHTASNMGLPLMLSARTFQFLLCALALAAPAAAQVYKYTDPSGKTVYTDKIPADEAGRANEQLGRTGTVMKRNSAAPTAAELVAREAERQRKRAENAAAEEQKRKNAALLDTYSNERDIDEARERALAANEQAVREIEQRIAEAEKRRKQLATETEFYLKKPMPVQLKRDIEANELELKVNIELFDTKRKEAALINAKYDEDKQRYLDLSAAELRANQVSPQKGSVGAGTAPAQRSTTDAVQPSPEKNAAVSRGR